MQASSFRSDLAIRASQIQIEFSNVNGQSRRWVLLVTHRNHLVELFCLPRLPVFGKPRRIRSYLKCFLCDDSGYLMMTMAITRRPCKPGNDDLRAEITDDAHEISQDLIARPFRKCVVGALGESEFVIWSEKLFRVVKAPCSVQFLSSNDSESFEQLSAQKVDSTFTSRRR